jgi:hypothetical protein
MSQEVSMNAPSNVPGGEPQERRSALARFGRAALDWLRGRNRKQEKKAIQTWEGEGGNLSPREPASTQQPH